MSLFQEGLQLVLQPHAVPRQLLFPACHGPPQALFGVRYETQHQFLGHQSPDQPLRIAEVMLAPTWCAIGFGLRQMQRPLRGCPAVGTLVSTYVPALSIPASNTAPSIP